MSEFNPLLLTAFVSKDAARQALTSSTNDWGAWPSGTHGTVPGVSGSDLGSLALAYCNEQFWFVYAMSDDGPGNVATKIFMASTANGKHWTVPTQPIANVVGDAGPAVASIDGALFVVWKSFGISYAGMAPQGAPEFQLGSEQWPINLPDEGPGEYGGGMSAVGCQGQHIVGYVAGGAAYVAAGPPGATSWGVPRSLGVATSAPPALATDGETLWAAVLDQSAVTAGGPAPVVVLASGPDAKGWERVSASPQVSDHDRPRARGLHGPPLPRACRPEPGRALHHHFRHRSRLVVRFLPYQPDHHGDACPLRGLVRHLSRARPGAARSPVSEPSRPVRPVRLGRSLHRGRRSCPWCTVVVDRPARWTDGAKSRAWR